MARLRRYLAGFLGGFLVTGALAGCVAPQPSGPEPDRFLVYFDEMSTKITDHAAGVIADATAKALALHPSAIRVEGRASAAVTPQEGHRLAEGRVAAVVATLERDGINPTVIHQVYVGQTGTGDTSVADRRVDIVLEH
jgi:outer membrane protein OmpA-like peptidoglycan-associated protein